MRYLHFVMFIELLVVVIDELFGLEAIGVTGEHEVLSFMNPTINFKILKCFN